MLEKFNPFFTVKDPDWVYIYFDTKEIATSTRAEILNYFPPNLKKQFLNLSFVVCSNFFEGINTYLLRITHEQFAFLLQIIGKTEEEFIPSTDNIKTLPEDNPLYQIFKIAFVTAGFAKKIYFKNHDLAVETHELLLNALPGKFKTEFSIFEVTDNYFAVTPRVFTALLKLINKDGKNIVVYKDVDEYRKINKEKLELEEKEFFKKRLESENLNRFFKYALNLRKIPNNDLYNTFSKEKSDANLLPLERKYIESRKLWTDIVSETYQKNAENSVDVKEKVIQRLKTAGIDTTKIEATYNSCMDLLTNHSVLTVTFDADKLKNILDFQILNIWEGRYGRQDSSFYRKVRANGESALFKYLSQNLSLDLNNNNYAAPRYGILRLIDQEQNITSTSGYGKSFIVFKPIVKLNTLFNGSDSLNYYHSNHSKNTSLHPCTVHNLENLLAECSDRIFEAILYRVHNGYFNKKHFFINHNDYLEAMLPAVNLLDKNLIEHIHVDNTEYTLSKYELELFTKAEISISNSNSSPYPQKSIEIFENIKNDDLDRTSEMLMHYPSLLTLVDEHGKNLLEHAIANNSLRIIDLLCNKYNLKQSYEVPHAAANR